MDTLRYYVGMVRDPLGFVAARFERYGHTYFVPGPGGGLYVSRNPDHLRDVLVTNASKLGKGHTALQQMARVLGDGLLTSDGDAWKRQRRMVQPAFSKARLAAYASVMQDEAARTTAGLGAGDVRDMSREMMGLTLRIVSRTLFGHDVAGETDEVARAMTAFQESVARPDLLPAFLPTPHRRRLSEAIETLDRIMYAMIDARRREASGQDDLLQMLVDARDDQGDGGRLSAKEVRDQLVTMFLAGHETTSHALTWTLYLLSQNPRADAALDAEIASVLSGRAPTYADLHALTYTEQVLKESMRLFPPAYSLARRADEDTSIGPYRVRRGSEVIVHVYHTHRDPTLYPDPLAFRPERFTEAEEAKRPPLAYLPFGAGPRTCIGKAFAMIEAKIILATLVQKFRFELARGQRVAVNPRITLAPRYGMKLRLVARDRVAPHAVGDTR
jgi:cytochrome P450